MSKLLDSINKSSSQVGETKQQYSTRARKFNRTLNNRSGALGNVELLIVEGKPKLVMKGSKEWFSINMNKSTDSPTQASTSATAAVNDPESAPNCSISATLVGNVHVQLSFTVENHNSFTIKRRTGSSFVNGTSETTIATAGASPITDTTATPSTTFVYQIAATNSFGTTVDDTEPITTNALGEPFNINFINPQDGSADDAWSDGDLIECAEFDEIDGTSGTGITQLTKYLNNTDFTNGDILYNNANTTTPFDGEAFNTSATGNNFFSMDGTIDKIFQVASNGVLSNVIDCAPIAPTITGVVNSSTSITLSIVGDMRVTRHLVVERKILGGSYSELTSTLAPTSSSSLAHDNITTGYTDTASLSAGTTYVYRVRGKNNTHNGIYSNELQLTTAAAGTSWSNVPADFTITAIGFNGEEVSGAKSITLTNGSGNTTIQCSQSGLTGQLSVAVSTSGDPGLSGTSNGATGVATSKTIGVAGTYNLRFKYRKLKNNTENVSCDVTFTNNTVTETGLDITCQGA